MYHRLTYSSGLRWRSLCGGPDRRSVLRAAGPESVAVWCESTVHSDYQAQFQTATTDAHLLVQVARCCTPVPALRSMTCELSGEMQQSSRCGELVAGDNFYHLLRSLQLLLSEGQSRSSGGSCCNSCQSERCYGNAPSKVVRHKACVTKQDDLNTSWQV